MNKMFLFSILIWFAVVAGWIMNVLTIANHLSDPLTIMIIFRMVGIFVFPIGVILGYV